MKFIGFLVFSFSAMAQVQLSLDVFNYVPFSDQFSEDGALIMNVDYQAVADVRRQIEEIYDLELEDRGEAHITVITPPEAQGWFTESEKGIRDYYSTDAMIANYSPDLQFTYFEVVCVGMQENDDGRKVFYLVVDAPGLIETRDDIKLIAGMNAEEMGEELEFDPFAYDPHITIGFVEGDVHGVSKGQDTCVQDIESVD